MDVKFQQLRDIGFLASRDIGFQKSMDIGFLESRDIALQGRSYRGRKRKEGLYKMGIPPLKNNDHHQ